MVITILAYKPDSDDYCRGCHMARYSADFEWKASMDRAMIAEFLSEILFRNKHLDTNETGYDTTFLFNGEECGASDAWDTDAIRVELVEKATTLCALKEADFQRVEAEKQKRLADKLQHDREEQERTLLATLQAKYPKDTVL